MRSATGSRNGELSLVIAAVVLPLPTSTELVIDSRAFVVSLGVELNVIHCDTRFGIPTRLCCISIYYYSSSMLAAKSAKIWIFR